MHHGIILRKDQKLSIPGGVLGKAISLYKTGFGVSVVDPNSNKLIVLRKDHAPTVEQFTKMLTAFKDNCLLISMMEAEEKLLETDVQPFTLLTNKEGEAQLVGYFDGGFDAFHKAGSTHTNEYLFVENHFRKELADKYAEVNGDIKKFMDLVRNPEYMGEMKGYCAPSNSIVLHAVTGEVVTVSKDTNATKTPYGWTTSLMGMTLAGTDAPAEEPKKDGDILGDIFKAEPPGKEVVAEPVKEDKPKEAPILEPHPDLADMVGIKPPANMSKNKYDSWYHNICKRLKETYGIGTGTKPSDWKDVPVLMVPRAWADKMPNVLIVSDPKKGKATEAAPPTSETTETTVVKPKVEKAVWENGYPVFDMKSEAELAKLAQSFKPVMSAEMWKALENKYAQFPETAHIEGGWLKVMQMSIGDIHQLVKNSPEGAELLIINLLGKMNQQKDLLFRTKPPVAEKVAA